MTHAVSGLFGAMVALAIYTRAGGLATVATAGAILVGYILWEMYRGWVALDAGQHDANVGWHRLENLRKADALRRKR